MRTSRFLATIGTAVTGAVLALALLPALVVAEVPSSEVPDALKSAIRLEVEWQGHEYAGLCRDIDQAANHGKYCAFVLSMDDDSAEVTYGPVASEPTAHIAFFEENGTWTHPGGGPGEGEAPSPLPELREAIRAFLEGKGFVYAGFCTEIAQDGSNIGKYCAAVSNLTETSATVSYGPVASDAIKEVRFEKVDGEWRAREMVALGPPNTGTGTAGGDDGLSMMFLGGAMALIAGSVALAFTAGRH